MTDADRRIVVVTRPEPGLAETMAAVRRRGWEPMAAPMLSVRTLAAAVPRRVGAVLFTSGQAIPGLAAHRAAIGDVPVLCVGNATARRAEAAGWRHVASAAGDAAALEALASGTLQRDRGPLLLACGCGQGMALAAGLRAQGFRVVRRCVYAATPARRLPDALSAALEADQVAAVLVFSADTARAMTRCLPERLHGRLAAIRCVAISGSAASVLSALPWREIAVAARPTADAVLDRLG
ncbi:uroporphyrinogen-III synthase [Rhizosaccharibacter radicis]|uniref:Uroporphyrinogen-III synthase n=1 Tax=Rhizosaccharibacter radicis TaxID=2782605 RepID=A0ABT1VVQ6_9PROT|nr:uroporphyrinogen-III synthase [Acetobacteraceae bacterium KSS12]